jgi:hypothetical protein
LLWYIQRYLIRTEIEALNLDLEKYLAEIQLPGTSQSASLNVTELYSEFWNGLLSKISITSYDLQMLQQLTVACSLSFFLQLWAWHALLSFHHSTKYAPSHLSSS